jgi:exonuclease SbcC
MIRSIILENFMAHEHTELELGPGVTALTGANNTGKSAIVEALRCVTTNPAPSHCIRHGAKEARVTVVMDDGARVVWIRKKRSAGYEITLPGRDEPEEPFWKLQGKVPDEVRALLRLDLVELETGEPVDVHLGNQREPVFLLNRPDSNVAAFFAASTESAHLLAMQNALKARTTEAKRRERELEARQERIEAELDALAGHHLAHGRGGPTGSLRKKTPNRHAGPHGPHYHPAPPGRPARVAAPVRNHPQWP